MRVPQVVTTAEELRNKEGKLEEALKLLKEHEKTSSKQDLLFVQQAIAILMYDTGHTVEALSKHKEAVQSAKKVGNEFIQADALTRIGWEMWMKNENNAKVLDYQDKAWKIVEKDIENKDLMKVGANIWAAKGNIYFGAKEYSKALDSYNKSIDLAQKCQFKQRISTVKGDIANVYIEQKKYDKARQMLEEMYSFSKDNYKHAVLASLIRLARLYQIEESGFFNISKSEKFLDEALQLSKTEHWRRDEAEVYDGKYWLYLKKGEKDKAEESKIKAIEIYTELGMKHRIKNLKRSN
ncbi:MAG: tetratricopeptide repeat protein [bacterium]